MIGVGLYLGEPPAGAWVVLLGIALVGLIAGFTWVRRISKLGDDPDRSFFRYRRRR